MKLGGGKNKNDIRGRLLNGFKQGVKGVIGQHVYFINNIHLIPPRMGGEENLVLYLPDIVNPGVGSPVDLDDIPTRPPADLHAAGADPAGVGGRALFTVKGSGENPGGAGFTAAPGAGKKIGMGYPAGFYRAFQGRGHKILARQLIKSLRSPSGSGYFISHKNSIS
jgi:hypothetical protein